MGWVRSAAAGGDIHGSIDRQSHGRQTNFVAARLIAQFQRDVLLARWGIRLRRYRHFQNDGAFVNIERSLGEGKRVQLALGIRYVADFESSGPIRFQIRRDQVVGGLFPRVDVKSITDLHDDGDLKFFAARHRVVRRKSGRSDYIFR